MKKLTHTDARGNARMVDVGDKIDQVRIARAEGFIRLSAETLERIKEDNIKKGDVLTVARIAGIQAAKKTFELIPLCHPLPIHQIEIREEIIKDGIKLISEVKTIGKTGVEMEALTAVSIALLSIYDMCKAVDKEMTIGQIRLVEKQKNEIMTK